MNPSRCRSYLQDLQRFGIKLGLENISAVLSSFHHPQRSFPSVHVAGTNGKGSVCAMLAEILSRHGLKVGLYTSPHLVRVEERIRVGDRMIPQKDFCRLTGVVKRRVERLLAQGKLDAPPTFFEVLTVIAFLYFRERKVDIAVLETGIGGRFDATNVVTPILSVITNISIDHREHLGTTLKQIAFEKAGIIKPGVPVVSGIESGDAFRVIRARAIEDKAPIFFPYGRDGRLTAEKRRGRYVFRFRHDGGTFRFSPGLRGEHQGMNAVVAITAASVLDRTWRPLQKKKIIEGVERAEWQGRLETFSRNPLVLLDGAHNEAGAAALKKYIEDFCGRPPVIVFAMMKDKAVKRFASLVFPLAREVILTSMPYPRAATPAEALSLVRPFGREFVIEPSLKKAVALARAVAGRRGTVLITGSLFLVGEAKKKRLGRG
jgi:dihydrofolate synthase / folylpolyglutamate synthase